MIVPTVLLLDVMDTLVRDPTRDAVRACFDLSLSEIASRKNQQAWVDFECGLIDEATFAASYFNDGTPLPVAELRAALQRRYTWIPGIPELLDELAAAQVPCHLLSNYPIWSSLVDDALGLGERIPWTFVSWRTGLRKPAPAAYLTAARALGVAPEHCAFVDDRVVNCEAAQAVGCPSHHFVDSAALRAWLVRLGLLKAPE